MTVKRGLFLDRDGVLNVDSGFVGRFEDFRVIDGVFPTLRKAQSDGFSLIVVTNQSGIARGYFTEEAYLVLEDRMRALFRGEGIEFAGIYHCPHHPDGIVPHLSVACDCRKPQPGMIIRGAREHGIDLASSMMVGDKQSDMEAARAAGIADTRLVQWPHSTLRDVWEE